MVDTPRNMRQLVDNCQRQRLAKVSSIASVTIEEQVDVYTAFQCERLIIPVTMQTKVGAEHPINIVMVNTRQSADEP